MKKYVIELNNDKLTETYFNGKTSFVRSFAPNKTNSYLISFDEKKIEEEIKKISDIFKKEIDEILKEREEECLVECVNCKHFILGVKKDKLYSPFKMSISYLSNQKEKSCSLSVYCPFCKHFDRYYVNFDQIAKLINVAKRGIIKLEIGDREI